MSAPTILIAVIAVAVSYPFVMRLLIDAAQPMRLKMADLGNELLDDPDLSEAKKSVVAGMMDDAFDWRFMIFASTKVPEFAWAKVRGKYLGDPLASTPSPEVRAKMAQLIRYFTLSAAVANPLFFLVATLEILFLLPCLRVLSIDIQRARMTK